MTYTEKILKRAACGPHDTDFIEVALNRIMFHDGSGVMASRGIRENNLTVNYSEKVVAIFDHYCPANTVKNSELQQEVRRFISEYGITHFHDCGEGICHQLMLEKGYVAPGDIVAGGDSHTTTYGAIGALSTGFGATEIGVMMHTGRTWLKQPHVEQARITGSMGHRISGKDIALELLHRYGTERLIFGGLELKDEAGLRMSDRITICNMGVEMGATFTVFPPDDTSAQYCGLNNIDISHRKWAFDAAEDVSWKDAAEVEIPKKPLIATPGCPSNVKEITEVEGTAVDQVVIGSCTNGRIEDLRQAAEAIGHSTVKARTVIVPASRDIYLQALSEGLINRFVRSGAMVLSPSCGPCMGAHLGLLGAGEVALATTNRNFSGRMGSPEAEIYLGNAWVAGRTAVLGKIGY